MRGILIAAVAAAALVAGCSGSPESRTAEMSSSTSRSAAVSTRQPVAPPPTMEPQTVTCTEAPGAIVEAINASFTDGEHLEFTQAAEAPDATTYVGGNIVRADGGKYRQNTWLVSGGAVFALTSQARRRTLLPDGRDVVADWPQYTAQVNKCVGQLERANR